MLADLLFGAVIKEGTLRVTDAKGVTRQYGNGNEPKATIRLHDRAVELKLFCTPKLAVGEAYMDGRLTIEEGVLYDFLRICAINVERLESHPYWSIFQKISNVLRHIRSFNPIGRARKNVAHHYDLSGELYDLFLDSDRQYSCAYFESPDDTLEQAQFAKKRHLAAKLLLDRPNLRVLDIGSGWGGMGLYLADIARARITGLTLSTEQHKVSNQRAEASGLNHQVKFELKDYREEEGRYDRIVSVGMFEHVGSAHLRGYFKKVKALLDDGGVMVLHTIGRSEPPGSVNPWITKYIFPGGYIPALSEVVAAIEKERLFIADIEVLRLHYAETLRHWRERFEANWDKAKTLYDERFCRMWEFYLAGCELSFRHMGQMVLQIQITKNQMAVPMTRGYVTDWERDQEMQQTRAAQ
jgi:cyclopropane-fatty-acyl-phospholipid synthase